jgi:hypothetical protein
MVKGDGDIVRWWTRIREVSCDCMTGGREAWRDSLVPSPCSPPCKRMHTTRCPIRIPAVSHICSFTVFLSTFNVRKRKSTPIVFTLVSVNVSSTKRRSMQDFPTPVSPTTTNCSRVEKNACKSEPKASEDGRRGVSNLEKLIVVPFERHFRGTQMLGNTSDRKRDAASAQRLQRRQGWPIYDGKQILTQQGGGDLSLLDRRSTISDCILMTIVLRRNKVGFASPFLY